MKLVMKNAKLVFARDLSVMEVLPTNTYDNHSFASTDVSLNKFWLVDSSYAASIHNAYVYDLRTIPSGATLRLSNIAAYQDNDGSNRQVGGVFYSQNLDLLNTTSEWQDAVLGTIGDATSAEVNTAYWDKDVVIPDGATMLVICNRISVGQPEVLEIL